MSLKSSPEPSIEYHLIDGVERLEMYEPGGYHPVMIDDLLHNRYRIVSGQIGVRWLFYHLAWSRQDSQTLYCRQDRNIEPLTPSTRN